ncbi:MAG: fumarylacetoacetate hydrolase family protein [Alphaproteobacteria bacterium]|nr:fumarylacetoacetate hydrolase family protein [Alphaproteobacteria bacterium]
MTVALSPEAILPQDHGLLVGRVWRPAPVAGPSVVRIDGGRVVDITRAFPTMADVLNAPDRAARVRHAAGEPIGDLAALLAESAPDRRRGAHFLAPSDLQPTKAAGVTFAISMLERVIEEQAKGDPARAAALRTTIQQQIGADLAAIVPGSAQADALKAQLIGMGAWSQYLEVGIGPMAEIFTKAPPMAAVGVGAMIGLHPDSTWNNPEPEIALAIAASGEVVGATLGNDVNLRDVEGRSALLLGRAKDNNASAALGPFLRLFDESFGIDDVRAAHLTLKVSGEDQFVLEGASDMRAISRDPLDLAAQTLSAHHQYPDGAFLMCGTLFAPIQDRDAPGQGFTHKRGDWVEIASPKLGRLVNRVGLTTDAPPWRFGARALMANLARRGIPV